MPGWARLQYLLASVGGGWTMSGWAAALTRMVRGQVRLDHGIHLTGTYLTFTGPGARRRLG